MASVRWYESKLKAAVREAEGLEAPIREAVDLITARANAMSSSYRTKTMHVDGQLVGNTQPRYEGDVISTGGRSHELTIGIVHAANYAAMKDNYENNTLLKAGG